MTVAQAINRGSLLYPADIEDGKVYAWLSELEERTSLQAKVKANFLNGGFLYSAGGILTDEKYYK